ncbi:MAG: YdeI/OmpD-associated family protein [Polyangiales bacterium]
MKRAPPAGQQMSFQATLENWAEGMDYCAVPVPAEITAALGTTGPVLVMARVNDSEPFQVSLFPIGGGKHYIRIKAKVRQETGTATGDTVQIRFTVLDRDAVKIPRDLMSALKAGGVADGFKSLPPGKQNFIIRRIDEAARPETREKRVQEAVEAAQEAKEKRVERSAAGREPRPRSRS